jgi:parafibromin
MDLLKKVLNDPKLCRLNPTTITVQSKTLPKSQTVPFREIPNKEYSLEELVFFILHKDLKYTEYLSVCKENGVGKIYYTDQKIIMNAIREAKEAPAAVRLDHPDRRYIGSQDYSHLRSLCEGGEEHGGYESYYIIVPSSLTAPVNLGKIEEFLRSGRCPSGAAVWEEDSVKAEINGVRLEMRDNVNAFTSEDWRRAVCIFVDGSKWQTAEWKIQDLAEVFNSIPTFYLTRAHSRKNPYLGHYNVIEILLEDDSVRKEELDRMWDRIKECIGSKKM